MRAIAVPFDGEGPGLTALQGGHVDLMPVGVAAAAEHIRAGRVQRSRWSTPNRCRGCPVSRR